MKNHELKRKIPKKRQVEVPNNGARVASSKRLQTMKRGSQSRDRKLVKEGVVDAMFLIGPDLAKKATVTWPDVDLIDESAPNGRVKRPKLWK
jgi:hypothetical protein